MDDTDSPANEEGRSGKLAWMRRHFFLLVVLTLIVGFVVYEYSRVFFAYTSDAYVTTDIVTVAPSVEGRLGKLAVRENQRIETGDLLFQLDLEPYQHRVALHKAELTLARQRHSQAQDMVREAQDDFDATLAALTDAQDTQRRVKELVDKRVATQQRLDDTTSTLNTAVAQHSRSQTAITVARERVQESLSEVARAEAAVALAEYYLGKASVHAPASGHIAPFETRVGDYVAVGQPVLTIVTDEDWRIVANLLEQHLKYLKVGQTVYFMISSRPWEVYAGKVKSFSRGISRSQEPPQVLPYTRPTTEWIRLSRRFPVEIDLEGLERKLDLFMGSDARVLILH